LNGLRCSVHPENYFVIGPALEGISMYLSG